MLGVLYALHIILCLSLILIVLIQSGKGSGLNMFVSDGMGQNMFGGGGGRTFFLKLTTGIAFAFMLTCVILAIIATRHQGQYQGVLAGATQQQAPASEAPAAGGALPAGQVPANAAAPVAPVPVGKPGMAPVAAPKPVVPVPAAPKSK